MKIREINSHEVYNLLECLSTLAEYHNKVSLYFKGRFPNQPYEKTLTSFCQFLNDGISKIAIIESVEKIIGFCKIDFIKNTGKLDYLIVLPEYRGNGYGKLLMDWAMKEFANQKCVHIEVKVIAGNETIHLYEKYGFKVKSHILQYDGQ